MQTFRLDLEYLGTKRKFWFRREHTVPVVAEAVSSLRPPDPVWMGQCPPQIDSALGVFLGYVLLDAWVANQDRHHQNWGCLLQMLSEGKSRLTIAPSFDHASSLGRELLPEDANRLIVDKRVANYVEKGRGGIYRASNDRRGANPLALACELARERPELFAPWLERLKQAGVPCGPINDIAAVLANEQLIARNMIVTMQDTDIGTLKLAGNPMKMSAFTDAPIRPSAQKLDERGREIRANGFKAVAD